MTDLLVTGAYGQLGRSLLHAARARGLEAVGHDLDTLDITDAAAVEALVAGLRPRALVNCAAYTAVDDCEVNEELATAVNATAVEHLARACRDCAGHFVHLSTDYVFAGDGTRPYLESDPVRPLSAYGRSKLDGEEQARVAPRHLIVRTAWLYGRAGNNFVEAIRRQIDSGASSLRVVADQTGCPTFSDDLADAILDLVACGATGAVHAVNSGVTTWHGFACEIARLLGAEVEIEPVTSADFPRPAPRPRYSVLDTSRLVSLIGRPLPQWQDALARYLGLPCAS